MLNGHNPIQKLQISEKIQQLNRLCNFSKKEKNKSITSKVDVSRNVPDEIWLKIMSYLKCKDVFHGFGKVSKHFNNLIHDPTAIKSIEFNRIWLINEFAQKGGLKVATYSKTLRSITISGNSCQNILLKQALISSPNLKSVTLHGISNQKLSLDTIVDCLTKARNIERLELLSNYEINMTEDFSQKALVWRL